MSMEKRKCKKYKEVLFREKLPEDRFEDYTNVTPWEKFVTDLQLLLLDWLKSTEAPCVETCPIVLIKTGIATFDSFEFKVEHFIVQCIPSTKQLNIETSRVLIVAFTYGLKEFVLISPADPDARRLVGTTRIRLLLSSIEMALAASKCELSVLVSYGNDKLYHGLRLCRQGFGDSLLPSDNLVLDSGLKKMEYGMAPMELPHAETHLAKLRDIFLEKVGTCKNLSISVLQYFRLVDLKFTGQFFSHLDNPVEFVYSPERLLSQVQLHLQLNLFADATNLHSNVINDDPDFRLVNTSPSDWFADCVISDAKYSLIDDVYESLTKAFNSDSIKISTNQESFMKSILDAELAVAFSREPSVLQCMPQESGDENLSDGLKCHYTGAPIRVLLVALHMITLRLSSNASTKVVVGAWLTFLKYLERTSEAELLTIYPVDEATIPFSDSPIDKALFVISQHHFLTSHESTKSNEEEFYDAVEELDVHHSGATPQDCPICRRAFEELENASTFTITNWIAPYLLAHHISLFHHYVVPPAITPWYGSQLQDLSKQISNHLSDYETIFQIIKDFHRRSLCAVSLYSFFKFCGTDKEFGHVVQELSDRLHNWIIYQVSKSLQVDHFNISRLTALPLDPKTRSMMAENLTNTFNNSRENTIIPVSLSTDSTGQSKSELAIQGASEEPFPAYRLVSISARHGARRPNPVVSGLTPQRLFVSIRYPPTNGEENSALLREKLEFICNGQSEYLDVETTYRERDSSCHVLLAGCFGEDCDIR